MATVLSIVNSALVKLGAMPVVDINNGTKESNLVGLLYETHRDFVLGEHGWKCATKRVLLTSTTTAPIVDPTTIRNWSYAYQLPSDYIRQVRNDDSHLKFQLEGNTILTNIAAPIMARYVWRVTDPSLFTAYLAETISYYMAQDIALSLTQDVNIANRLTQQYLNFLKTAKFKDSSGSKAPIQTEDFLVNARLQGNHL